MVKFNKKIAVYVLFVFILTNIVQGNLYSNNKDNNVIKNIKNLYSHPPSWEKAEEKCRYYISNNIIKDEDVLAEIYFYQALISFCLGKEKRSKVLIKELIKTYPGFELKNEYEYPQEFNDIFYICKKGKSKTIVIYREGTPHKKKFPTVLVIAGVGVIIAAIVLLGKKNNSDENNSTQVSANYDTNTLGIEWVSISSGEFQMGSNKGTAYGKGDAMPVHTVYLGSYYVSKYEVTFDQYDKFCEETGKTKPNSHTWGRGNMPVMNVNWNDAKAFCDWLSNKTGKNIHLPTEAQWEYAARGAYQRDYPWGNSKPTNDLCVFLSHGPKEVDVCPLGKSPFGIYNMAGNVAEWCSDFYEGTYYQYSPKNNPTGPSSGSGHVIRGGSWYDGGITKLFSWERSTNNPVYASWNIGFRIAMNN